MAHGHFIVPYVYSSARADIACESHLTFTCMSCLSRSQGNGFVVLIRALSIQTMTH